MPDDTDNTAETTTTTNNDLSRLGAFINLLMLRRGKASTRSGSKPTTAVAPDYQGLPVTEDDDDDDDVVTEFEDDEDDDVESSVPPPPLRRQRQSRWCCCSCCCCCNIKLSRPAKILLYTCLTIALYFTVLEAWVNLISKSTPAGFNANEQHLTPVALLLLPLTPWIRQSNRRAMPVFDAAEMQVTPLWEYDMETTEANVPQRTVAVMPALLPYDDVFEELFDDYASEPTENNNDDKVDFRLGGELSGCTPKFEIELAGDKKYLFKPSENNVQVWNELLAYVVNRIGQFHRIPPVHPFSLPLQDVKEAVQASHAVATLPWVKCDFDLSGIERWIHTSPNPVQPSSQLLIGTLQLMVGGNVWKRSKTVQRARSKIGRWTDKPLSKAAQREIDTRAILDILIGNYDRYNNDFTQTISSSSDESSLDDSSSSSSDDSSDDNDEQEQHILVYIDQGSYANVTLIESRSFPLAQYCRFYFRPMAALYQHRHNLTDTVVHELLAMPRVAAWDTAGLIDIAQHPTIVHLQERVNAVLTAVDDCVAMHGHDYVFRDV